LTKYKNTVFMKLKTMAFPVQYYDCYLKTQTSCMPGANGTCVLLIFTERFLL